METHQKDSPDLISPAEEARSASLAQKIARIVPRVQRKKIAQKVDLGPMSPSSETPEAAMEDLAYWVVLVMLAYPTCQIAERETVVVIEELLVFLVE
jgi:hypothetical protein